MPHKKITETVTSVGILNPNLRVFDVVMATEFGTSYNAYIVEGRDKIALIETSHASFYELFLENLEEVLRGRPVDFIIINHSEPDHSGSLRRLLGLWPGAQVIASAAGGIYLKAITNLPDLPLRVVKDGEQLDLGGRVLTFRMAPFLHWPDSMFTHDSGDNILFTCDFLGTHYCEPGVFDRFVTYPRDYQKAFRGYYDAIFSPFPKYVKEGLRIVREIAPDFCCVSHGPVLTRGGLFPGAIAQYDAWSDLPAREGKLIPIFYCTAYGNTRRVAEALREGILAALPDADAPLYDIIEHDMGEQAGLLNRADAILLGSPTINRDAVPPLYVLLSHVDAIGSRDRPALVFGSYGWSGEACANIAARLQSLKMKPWGEGFRVNFVPIEADLARARAEGEAFARSI